MRLKLKEAIAYGVLNGRNVSKFDIAKSLWPDSKELTQRANIHKLHEGTTKTYRIEWIKIIHEMTGYPILQILGLEDYQI